MGNAESFSSPVATKLPDEIPLISEEKENADGKVMMISTPILDALRSKDIVLASSSLIRHEIFASFGLTPKIVKSTFLEDLPKSAFVHTPLEYAPHTAACKGLEVYRRLVADGQCPDLVIAADTILLSGDEILEKPNEKHIQREMLNLVNGKVAEMVTGVSIIYPTISAPGYAIKSLCESTSLHFYENSAETIEAYIATEEALQISGGVMPRGMGGMLIKKVDGDWNNANGFPAAAFFRWLEELKEEDSEFLNM